MRTPIQKCLLTFTLPLLLCLFVSCGSLPSVSQSSDSSRQESPSGSRPEEQELSAVQWSDLIPGWEDTQRLSVVVDRLTGRYSMGNRVLASANEQELGQLLTLLRELDLNRFSVTEETGYTSQLEMRLETTDTVYDLQFGYLTDYTTACLAVRYSDGSRLLLQGPEELAFWHAFDELHTTIAAGDAERCGTVTPLPDGQPYTVSNWFTCRLLYILDDFLLQGGTEAGHGDIPYDVRFTFGEKSYQLESATGKFFREQDGQTLYGVVDAQVPLMDIRTALQLPLFP